MTFIVSLDDPVDMVALPGDQQPMGLDAFVGGLHLRPATIAHQGSGAGVSIELSPLGSRALFGLPAASLATLVVDLRDLLGRAGDELVDRLRTAPPGQRASPSSTTSWAAGSRRRAGRRRPRSSAPGTCSPPAAAARRWPTWPRTWAGAGATWRPGSVPSWG